MKKHELELPGLLLIELDVWRDSRGFFVERYQEGKFMVELGMDMRFVQDNHSRSVPGVVRGLHYQRNPDQGKLVGALRGRIFDVVVDLRPKSPTYGKWHGEELSDQNGKLLWVPPGFAHGFCVLGNEDADVMYKVDAPYSPKTEGGIRWNDPELQIQWPVKEALVSPKDQVLPTFAEYRQKPVF